MAGIAISGLGRDGAVVIKFQRVVAVIGDCAVNLVRHASQRRHDFAAFRFCHGYLATTGEPFVQRCGSLPCQQPADLEVSIHFRAMVMDALKSADRAAELFACFRVGDGEIERCLAEADQFRRLEGRSAKVQSRDVRPCTAGFADNRIGIDRDALKRCLPQ